MLNKNKMIKDRLSNLDYVKRVAYALDFLGGKFKYLETEEAYKLATLTGSALTMAFLVNYIEKNYPDGENDEFIIDFILTSYKDIAEALELINHKVYLRTVQQN